MEPDARVFSSQALQLLGVPSAGLWFSGDEECGLALFDLFEGLNQVFQPFVAAHAAKKEEDRRARRQAQNFASLCFGGLAGSIAEIVWMSHFNDVVFPAITRG
ncbi:MAG: hypothetical protein BWX68_03040 [Verrucomicrobia bacterium ADurb.Bin063]|nr:MAG: hypothetical protein BWX68_03040 [Verrucomicrobia bacterium ADurb.Bin063]